MNGIFGTFGEGIKQISWEISKVNKRNKPKSKLLRKMDQMERHEGSSPNLVYSFSGKQGSQNCYQNENNLPQ